MTVRGFTFPIRPARALEVLVVVAACAVGWYLARDVPEQAPAPGKPAAAVVAAGHGLRLQGDPEWTALRTAPAVPGFPQARTIGFSPQRGAQGVVVAALLPVSTPSLLPAALAQDAGRPDAITFGGQAAWRYSGLQSGRWSLDVVALPTTRGVVTLACGVTDGDTAVPDCLSGIRSVRVPGGAVVKPRADLAFQQRLAALLPAMNKIRVDARTDLRRASHPKGQAAAARRLWRAYQGAAVALRPVLPPSGAPTALPGSLTNASQAYRRLSIAAGHRDFGAWRRASRAVRTAEAQLSRRISGARVSA
jgi:hypothetical protein